ncbi:subtype B tannase [Streptomyces sp. NPDC048179]|uniref:subtype B tannase n=1 Tax=Streptomyces sp. NPDC048179 TaxID=3365506 RepID=UPI003710AB05
MQHRAIKRRNVVIGIGATAGVALAGGIALTAQASDDKKGSSTSSGALVFDKDDYTELTETIADAAGTDHSVTYRFYKPRNYVTNPSDDTHQSLVVSVPVKIDGKTVDASRAPIVLANAVGAYMPSTVATATGVGQAALEMGTTGGTGTGTGGIPSGSIPSGMPSGGTGTGGTGGTGAVNGTVNLAKLALAAGYVVVEPGTRGRSLTDSSGSYYGTAPAVIVDLKAAVRYIRFNKGRLPGNTDRIVSTGTSAGGASSALLGASGDSPIYDKYLTQAGAADASDAIFATGAWCPITDLEHADGAYEWNWGSNVTQSDGKVVDQTVSKQLQAQFAEYQAKLKLRGLNGYGALTARNYDDYLLTFLQPSATKYLAALSDADRTTYLAKNTFITWSGGKATFTWDDYLTHVGARKKTSPAFDAFDLSAGENNEFGEGTTATRHFTAYSAKNDTTGLSSKRVASDIPELLKLMNPMYHLHEQHNPHRSKHWWIRLGTSDTDTSHVISANLAATADNLGDDVNYSFYWDKGHATNEDPGDFITWVAKVTGHKS